MTHYKKRSIRKKQSNTKRRSRKQRLWKMKGCAKYANMTGGCGCGAQVNNIMTGGGDCARDILAYSSPPDKINCVNNLAYTGKGGKRTPSESQFINDNLHVLLGGYGTCKGDNMPSGALYPSSAMGPPWTSFPLTWPGVAGVQGSPNHLAYNNYLYPQADRMLENTEAIPYAYGGKPKKHTFRKHNKTNKHKNKKRQKGGLPTLGILTEIKNTWNTLRGNPQLPSPLPFNNQLENQNQLNIQ